jgi:hypothetical protein
MSVNSGRATATRFLSPQSATWSTVSGTLNTSGGTLSVGGVSNGVLNVAGTGSLTSGTLRLLRTNPIGTVSLLDGGTIVGSPVINSAGTGIFNFKPALTNRSPTINVSAPNLGGISLNGSNSTETPIVQIGGGGISSGIGASAIANIDSSGNLIGITLASPGNSYAIAGSPMLSPSSASSATLSAVPEPSSLVLAGLALTTLFAARRFCS